MLRHWIAVAALAAVAALPPAVTAQGITPTTIVIGQSAATTGPASELGTAMRAGALAYFNAVNARGGINGRRIELRTLDDGYEPDRSLANTRRFLETDQAFALFGYVGTPTTIAAMPVFTKAQVPLIGPFTGAEAFRKPFNRYIFNVRASYYAETDKLVDLLATLKLQRIAVFYQNDAYGKAGLEGVERAAKARNMPIAATATVERNSVDVKAAVLALSKVDPQAVVMISAYKSCAAFIKAMKAAGIHAQFMNVSFVGSKALAAELGPEGRGVAISQVVPFPWNTGSPVVKEYQKALAAETGKENYSFTSLEGFIAAKVLVEGLRRTGPALTRDKFISTMENFSFDAGGFLVSYSPTDHSGSRFVELTVITKDGKFLR